MWLAMNSYLAVFLKVSNFKFKNKSGGDKKLHCFLYKPLPTSGYEGMGMWKIMFSPGLKMKNRLVIITNGK